MDQDEIKTVVITTDYWRDNGDRLMVDELTIAALARAKAEYPNANVEICQESEIQSLIAMRQITPPMVEVDWLQDVYDDIVNLNDLPEWQAVEAAHEAIEKDKARERLFTWGGCEENQSIQSRLLNDYDNAIESLVSALGKFNTSTTYRLSIEAAWSPCVTTEAAMQLLAGYDSADDDIYSAVFAQNWDGKWPVIDQKGVLTGEVSESGDNNDFVVKG